MKTTDKLQHGDYVEGLTEEQARELLDMDTNNTYTKDYPAKAKSLYFDGRTYNELFIPFEYDDDLITLHDFLSFRQKCSNHFGNEKDTK